MTASSRLSPTSSAKVVRLSDFGLRSVSSGRGSIRSPGRAGGRRASPEPRPERLAVGAGQIGDRLDPHSRQPLRGLRPDPGDQRRRPVADPVQHLLGRRTQSPSGLSRSDAIFASSLFSASPTEQTRPVRSRISAFSSPGPRLRHSGARQVEVRLVDPDDLDPVAVAAQDGHHLAGDVQVGRAVAGYLDQVGAAAVRDRQRQRRVDPVAAGLVGGGHDDAAGPVLAAGRDDHGLAAQLRPARSSTAT